MYRPDVETLLVEHEQMSNQLNDIRKILEPEQYMDEAVLLKIKIMEILER